MDKTATTPENAKEAPRDNDRKAQFIAVWAEAAARLLKSARTGAEVYAEGLFRAGASTSDIQEAQNARGPDGTRADGDAESL